MDKINFFTPVIEDNSRKSPDLLLLSRVDNYFYLGGKQAKVISGHNQGKSEGVNLVDGEPSAITTAIKIVSYFTVIIPLIMLIIKSILRSNHSFYVIRNVTVVDPSSTNPSSTNRISSIATPPLQPSSPPKKTESSSPIQTVDSKTLRSYTGNLDASQKSKIKTQFTDDTSLQIAFLDHPGFNVSIRRQNIFNSQAEVIVNAANTHLGGGGGIDGAIHRAGGDEYAAAHRELQKMYHSQYVQGHAAMIRSGKLKQKHNIDNVIVVAGPQGSYNATKADELYSCYYNSLMVAHAQNKKSIAFPSVSTGVFEFPKDRAAAISLKALHDFIHQHPKTTLTTISIHFLPSEPKENLNDYQTSAS